MAELLNIVRGAIALDIPTFVRFRDSEDVFRRGVTVLVLVALIVGAVAFAVDFITGLTITPEEEIAQAQKGFEQMLQAMSQFMPSEYMEEFRKQFPAYLETGLGIGRGIAALDTPLPRGLITFFQALGRWVHRPLAMLGGLLGYGIWVMLAAKLLGGKGRLQEFLGTAALSSLPYLLLVLEKLPCVGSLLGLVAWVWSTIIWVVATAVSHGWAVPVTTAEGEVERYEVSWGKPILAVILPALALVVVFLIGGFSLVGIIVAVIRSAGG